jgi:paraquat-inducible protein B
VNDIPFEQIGENLDGILRATNQMANGSQLQQALTDLSATLNSTKGLIGHLDADSGPTLRQLPAAITTLEKTLTNVNKLVLSADNGYGNNTQFNRDLERLLQQLNDMVHSIRAVADMLARHPEALIKGRVGGLE